MQVVDHRLEVGDQRPFAVRPAVTDVVEPDDEGAVGGERAGDVVVAADVLAVAVRDDDDVGGVGGGLPLLHVEAAGVPVEAAFAHARTLLPARSREMI